MVKRAVCVVAAVALEALARHDVSADGQERALAVAREVEHLASQRTLWPGFDARAIPLAIYIGERTYLFRHPVPPKGFTAVAGSRPAAYSQPGRHPAVTANSSAEIGGIMTATLLTDASAADRPARALAAVALHEAFHVYQRKRHPGWQGNEGDFLLYPVTDARLLALRRLETEALRRALADSTPAHAAGWTRRALGLRAARFASMDSAFSNYERRTELNEGLATYVQLRAEGKSSVEIPAREFAASDVRQRVYAIGPALAFLLDRFQPGWQELLESGERTHLDQVLEAAVSAADTASCTFTDSEVADIERRARQDAQAVVGLRVERRKAFDARPGWRLIIEAADGRPLWPQGFDPLNVQVVEGGLLHTRFLRLGNDSGQMEAIDGTGADLEALTEGLGPHPLFNGIRRVVIAGLAKPEVTTRGSRVEIRAPGLAVGFANARMREVGTEVVVQLGTAK
ncbi:MAG TPA: hypothetical protein VGK93_00010 [Candidatus Eisenbacteria bacterium]